MLHRLYVNNFRCLENFEFTTKGISSGLLIGKNGSGKSTIARALEVFQSIGRGINKVNQLVQPQDFSQGRSNIPIRFEIEVFLQEKLYKYSIAFDFPENFKEMRVYEEELIVNGTAIYTRKEAQITLLKTSQNRTAEFLVDWHLVALPVIQEQSQTDPLHIFKTGLNRMIILAPIPSFMNGDSRGETLEPKRDGSNFGEWFSGLLSRYPAAYTQVDKYLRNVIPDFKDVRNELMGKDFKSMIVRFEEKNANLSVYFSDLSDGEKCFFLGAVLVAANQFYGPLFCFWDEPDNYLSLSEVGHFVTSLRRSFKNGGQLLVTSHNPEGILKFSNENTWLIHRKSHLEPTLVRPLEEITIQGDLMAALIQGDLDL
ncbi:AAA family ATPase [Laspinema olomoucense]|uniref:AAA family ATPase n=1 Tax=Laspinema olomoucense D3b TaxID=2953688 RepID=A0ABT2NEU3_9CYAN|nr:ATP-binding protein [Laspinema sp. D3b]MCT7980250.1 AAA family ATPase [Laspinema sp. D3b]